MGDGRIGVRGMGHPGQDIKSVHPAWISAYEPGREFCSIDYARRYAEDNQPNITQWKLVRLLRVTQLRSTR
jgi:hypothetical protein